MIYPHILFYFYYKSCSRTSTKSYIFAISECWCFMTHLNL